MGIEMNAVPNASLKRSLEELEVKVAKAIANNQMEELNDNEDEEKQRKPLNNLKSKTIRGKTVVPVIRKGNAVKKTAEGLKNSVSTVVQNKGPAIYCDENDPIVVPKPMTAPPVGCSVKAVITDGLENDRKPGKWSENVLTQKRVATETQPKFAIHADDSDDESPEPIKKPPQSNALKLRPKNADSPPIARFEKPDPFKKFAFNVNKVYAGGEEFSFEEIRGRKWMAKKKREEEALRNKKLEEEVAELRKQVALLLQRDSQQSSQSIPVQKNDTQQNKESTVRPSSASPPSSSAESSTAKSANLTNHNSMGNGTALSLVRDLWNGTLANQTADSHETNAKIEINADINKTKEKVQKNEPFAIYADTTLSKTEDKMHRPRESVGFIDYTIALPKTEQTFFANTNCASTPVGDKSKKSEERYNLADIPSLQNNYNFIGGLTAKLSPIVETSREYNSKSSSSSSGTSGMSTTGGQVLSRRVRALSGVENINPFDVNLLNQLLESLFEPISYRKGFYRTNESLPKIKPMETLLKLGPDYYKIYKLIATGAYAQIFTAQIDATANEENDSYSINKYMSQNWFALKVAKEANEWEFYICDELHKRLYRSKCVPDIVSQTLILEIKIN